MCVSERARGGEREKECERERVGHRETERWENDLHESFEDIDLILTGHVPVAKHSVSEAFGLPHELSLEPIGSLRRICPFEIDCSCALEVPKVYWYPKIMSNLVTRFLRSHVNRPPFCLHDTCLCIFLFFQINFTQNKRDQKRAWKLHIEERYRDIYSDDRNRLQKRHVWVIWGRGPPHVYHFWKTQTTPDALSQTKRKPFVVQTHFTDNVLSPKSQTASAETHERDPSVISHFWSWCSTSICTHMRYTKLVARLVPTVVCTILTFPQCLIKRHTGLCADQSFFWCSLQQYFTTLQPPHDKSFWPFERSKAAHLL